MTFPSSMVAFLFLNVNGLRDINKHVGLLQWLSHLSLEFVCLQETHILSADEGKICFSAYAFSCLVSPGTAHSCGSVILYRPRYTLDKFQIDAGGRFVMADFKYHEIAFRIVCLYAPNRNPSDDFFSFWRFQRSF